MSHDPIKADDPVIYRRDLYKRLRISSETLRRWMRDDKLPKPDVKLSQRSVGWKVSTLEAAGHSIF